MTTGPSAETPGLAPETGPSVLATIQPAGDASVAHIVLNRPQSRNAITVGLARGLSDALRSAAAQARVIGLALPLRDGLALETETIIAHLGGPQAAAEISRFTDRGLRTGPKAGESS